MLSLKQQRSLFIFLMLLGVSLSVFFFLRGFEEDIVFFYTPSDILTKGIPQKEIRLGGLVKEGSILKDEHSIQFTLTDTNHEVHVYYQGLVPNLFREGQGIVAKGRFQSPDHFIAKELLAKHDENYRPPELTKKLDQNQRKSD